MLGQTGHRGVVVRPQDGAQMCLADVRVTTATGVQAGGMVRGQ